MPDTAQLKAALTAFEALTSVQVGNDNEEGLWHKIALTAEELAGVSNTANGNIHGFMLRTALALETISGTSGAEENLNQAGLLKRIVDALEAETGVGTGSLEHRFAVAAAAYAGGGGGLEPTLSAPLIVLTSAPTAYPVTISADFYADHQVGDDVRIVAASDYAFASETVNDTITMTGVVATDLAAINAALAGISSPAVSYIRIRVENSPEIFSEWSNVVLHGTAAVPAITSPSPLTIEVYEGFALAQVITLDGPVHLSLGGDDRIMFELIGDQPGTSFTLRFMDNAVKNFEAPDDFDTDGTYDIVFERTSLADEVATSAATVEVLYYDTLPSAISFTDNTGATLGQTYTSTVTLAGVVAGAVINGTFSNSGGGGDYRIHDGTSWGAYTTAANFTWQLGYQLESRIVAAGSAGVTRENTFVTGDPSISDTHTITTIWAGAPTRPEAAVAQWSAQYESKLFQNIDGTGAVSADSTVVGTLQNMTPNARHLTARANDGTRPLWRNTGGRKYITADGVDDLLKLAVNNGEFPFQHIDGVWTIAAAVQANPASATTFLSMRGSDNGNPIAAPLQSRSGAGADLTWFYRDDPGTGNPTGGSPTTTNRYTGMWDNTDRVVMLVCDGDFITPYRDGVAGTAVAVDEAGLDFIDTFNLALFGYLAAITPSQWFNCPKFAEMVIWNIALNSAERATELTRLAALQLRTL
jgi:hypothetical protein